MDKKENAMNDACTWAINRGTVAKCNANHFNSHDDDRFEMKQLFLIISSSELQKTPKGTHRSRAFTRCSQWCSQCGAVNRTFQTVCVSVRSTELLEVLGSALNPFAQSLDPTQ